MSEVTSAMTTINLHRPSVAIPANRQLYISAVQRLLELAMTAPEGVFMTVNYARHSELVSAHIWRYDGDEFEWLWKANIYLDSEYKCPFERLSKAIDESRQLLDKLRKTNEEEAA